MTDTPFPAAKAPTTAKNSVGEGSIINGRIMVWMDGLLRPATPSEAWSEWIWLAMSPLPETQARARAIPVASTMGGGYGEDRMAVAHRHAACISCRCRGGASKRRYFMFD